MSLLIVALSISSLVLVHCIKGSDIPRNVVIKPPRLVHHPASTSTQITNITIYSNIHASGYRGYTAISSAALSIRIPEHGLKRPSHQASGCSVLSNGGPFQGTGEPVGPVIVNRNILHSDFSSENVGFGVTSGNEWVLGGLKDDIEAGELQIQTFLGGFNWLVYNGSSAVPKTNPTGAERSPRTIIGVTVDGRLIVGVVDGCEKCFRHKGLTLQEIATFLIDLGAWHAINLDGGSSSTFVLDGEIINRPTCLDVELTCERPVATCVCLLH